MQKYTLLKKLCLVYFFKSEKKENVQLGVLEKRGIGRFRIFHKLPFF